MAIIGSYGDPDLIEKLINSRMPFGKYSRMLLTDLPLVYLHWFARKGFPGGELGQLLRVVYDVKSTGMEHLFEPIRSRQSTDVYGSTLVK